MKLAQFLHQHLPLCGIGIMWLILNSCFLSLPAVAEIAYTPVNVTISGNGGIKIDLNHDGIVDFTIASNAGFFPCSSGASRYAGVDTLFPATGNDVVGGNGTVAPLTNGVLVSASDTFQTTQALITSFAYLGHAPLSGAFCAPYAKGWCYPAFYTTGGCNLTAYMGLAFKINGQIHYGWANLSIYVARGVFHTTLKGFAYETVAGRGIMAGATSGD